MTEEGRGLRGCCGSGGCIVVKKCGVVIHTSFDTCMKMSAPDVNILVSNSIVADCQDYYCPNAASAH